MVSIQVEPTSQGSRAGLLAIEVYKRNNKNSPETHLTVAGGIDVPVGDGLEHLVQPATLSDGLDERRGRHGD